ncbi:hypothetical protein BC628DRAFT_168065 [Trametes gibbosa]|nr:hypothetical protein BC628DRAFT_168065 [Trametes gibbosa]
MGPYFSQSMGGSAEHYHSSQPFVPLVTILTPSASPKILSIHALIIVPMPPHTFIIIASLALRYEDPHVAVCPSVPIARCPQRGSAQLNGQAHLEARASPHDQYQDSKSAHQRSALPSEVPGLPVSLAAEFNLANRITLPWHLYPFFTLTTKHLTRPASRPDIVVTTFTGSLLNSHGPLAS